MLNIVGVIVALTILNLPFTLLLLKNFFDTVPIELEEAAYVEGATLWQIVTRIVLPLSRAGLAVVWFFCFTGAWNEFLLPLIFSRTEASLPDVGRAVRGVRPAWRRRLRFPRGILDHLRGAGCRGVFHAAAQPEHRVRRRRSQRIGDV